MDAPPQGWLTETERVENWRLHELVEAGYPLPLAERIAQTHVDLHHAIDLLEHGCPPELAAEILL